MQLPNLLRRKAICDVAIRIHTLNVNSGAAGKDRLGESSDNPCDENAKQSQTKNDMSAQANDTSVVNGSPKPQSLFGGVYHNAFIPPNRRQAARFAAFLLCDLTLRGSTGFSN